MFHSRLASFFPFEKAFIKRTTTFLVLPKALTQKISSTFSKKCSHAKVVSSQQNRTMRVHKDMCGKASAEKEAAVAAHSYGIQKTSGVPTRLASQRNNIMQFTKNWRRFWFSWHSSKPSSSCSKERYSCEIMRYKCHKC